MGQLASKYSPLIGLHAKGLPSELLFVIKVKDSHLFETVFDSSGRIRKLFFHPQSQTYIVQSSLSWIKSIADINDNVLFVDLMRTPKEELFTGTIENNVSSVNKLQHYFPSVNATGITIGLKENAFDTTDIDYRRRYKINNAASSIVSNHASIMGTVAAGAGNSWYATKSAAWGSSIASSSFANLLPDSPTFFSQFGVSVQNHSYGTGVENYYGAEAVAYDGLCIDDTSLVQVFSSGNSGFQAPALGLYAGLTGFANLSGNFKMAKNVLVVGAIDSFYAVTPISSKGPSYDGRVKPEVVAQGQDGTSGAAAIVSGVAATLQQAYKDNHSGRLPASSLIKAILINSADDVGAAGPDYQSGFGSVNAYKAMQAMVANTYKESAVSQSGEQAYLLSVPPGIQKIKITLAWNDRPATVNASKALVNDLDLELTDNTGLQKWLPWVLSKYPAADSLLKPAERKRDTLNNIEQITLDFPSVGDYIIKVKGSNISSGQQKYSLAWQLDEADKIEWGFPMRNDPVLAGEQNVLRWKSTMTNTSASLHYSIDGGSQWQVISNTVDLSKGYIKWNAPLAFTKALLRITAGSAIYTTDTFVISKRMTISTGFNCADTFMIFWNSVQGASQYKLYKLDDKYFEPFLSISDTSKVLLKNIHGSLYYAVAPIVGGREGVRSFATNYASQGTACYLKSFYAEKVNDVANLYLQLGSVYGINSIAVQLIVNGDTIDVEIFSNPLVLDYLFAGYKLQQGLNQFRIVLNTANGLKIYSAIASVFYADESNLFLYPNPVKRGGLFTIIFNDKQSGELIITDATGRALKRMNVQTGMIQLTTANLPSGVYFLHLKGGTTNIQAAKLVVY